LRILLVEDSERLCRSVGTALRKSGYAVDVANDGQAGLWFAESNNYDVIVLDIMLPKLDGLSLLRSRFVSLTAASTGQRRSPIRRSMNTGKGDEPFTMRCGGAVSA
jgi:CheY-like chemotaxis protein